MFTKLTALQRELMTEAARREDRLLTIPWQARKEKQTWSILMAVSSGTS